MTRKREPWSRLLRAVAANEPFLPALRPHLQQLRSLIAEDDGSAYRRLRRRQSFRVLQSARRKNLNAARQKRKAGRM